MKFKAKLFPLMGLRTSIIYTQKNAKVTQNVIKNRLILFAVYFDISCPTDQTS